MNVSQLQDRFGTVCDHIETVIQGKREKIERVVTCLLAGGHLLIEDIPGVGKTMLARALARSLNARYRRVQFTPDLLPADVTGMSVFEPDTGSFHFNEGPIFTNILLADEINRTTPRTQSALLEAMQDQQVTVDGETHALDPPFMVIATQNPLEFSGTYPLPESQLDRFLFRIEMGYPDEDAEDRMLQKRTDGDPLDELAPQMDLDDVRAARNVVRAVRVEAPVRTYILRIAERTRNEESFRAGVSPRGNLFLQNAAQARAALNGRDFVTPDDVRVLAHPVLAHRILPRSALNGRDRQHDVEETLEHLLEHVEVPI